MDKVLFKANGSKLLSNSWKQELVITTKGIKAEGLQVGKRVSVTLPFSKIAQVNLVRNVMSADIEIASVGSQSVTVKALKKVEAEKAKKLIESKL